MEKTEELPLIVSQKRFLENLLEDQEVLTNKPEELRKRVLYLSLRGLREGLLQYMEMFKINDVSKINNFFYFAKIYDPNKRKMRKVKEKFGDIETERHEMLNTVEENIKRRLMREPIINKYFSSGNKEILESNCQDLARYIAEEYGAREN